MKQLTLIEPYSDSNLNWNSTTKQYELTETYCNETFDVRFADSTLLPKRIKKNSRKIYNYISDHIYSKNRAVCETLLNRTREGREFILKILTEQMDADIESGYNDLSNNPPINVANGQVIDRNEFIRNQISVDAEQIFNNSDAYFGIRLGFMSLYPPIYFAKFNA